VNEQTQIHTSHFQSYRIHQLSLENACYTEILRDKSPYDGPNRQPCRSTTISSEKDQDNRRHDPPDLHALFCPAWTSIYPGSIIIIVKQQGRTDGSEEADAEGQGQGDGGGETAVGWIGCG
jgi:hypothetical protein